MKNILIVFITITCIFFHVNAAENYFTKHYYIEGKKKPLFSNKNYITKIPFILVKGKHVNCNNDYFADNFNCLAHPESTHFIKTVSDNKLISYDDKRGLIEPIKYTVYKEFRIVHKNFWSRLFNSPKPYVLLKSQDGKVIEMDIMTFNYYIAKDNNYQVQDDIKSNY